MSRSSHSILFHVLCMIIGLLFFSCDSNRYDWRITYEDRKDHVYGTYIIKNYLDNISSKNKSDIKRKLSKYFDEDNNRSGSYFFVGDGMLVDESDATALVKFVSKGNLAIISTKVFPNTISSKIFSACHNIPELEEEGVDLYSDEDSFYYEEEDESDDGGVFAGRDSIIYQGNEKWKDKSYEHLDYTSIGVKDCFMKLNEENGVSLETDTIYKTVQNGEHYYRNWFYLHDSLACIAENDINVLGYVNDTLINFFEIPYGDGAFLIHTNPIVFTNVNMLNDQSAAYISSITNKSEQDDWHWDEYSRTSEQRGKMRNKSNSLISNKGPLTYILKQEPLKWAWYCLLSMGALFLIFRAKRKQRVVPILEENENTSLSFINTIGSLYFNKNDHKQLCEDQMQLWLEDIRHHYRINTSKLDEDFVAILSAKTKKSKEDIQSLLKYYNNIENSEFVSENTMVAFYQQLNKFSIQTKS